MGSRRTRPIPRDQAFAYLAKAREFLAVAELARADGLWDAVGLNAVHATISAADGVMAFRGGVRSAEQDHRAIRDLLEDTVGAEAKHALRHLTAVLAKKNLVEYEQRRLTAKEAQDMLVHAGRFLVWAQQMLPPAPHR
ncbi:MAG: hypothetical protein ACYC5Q_14115 [Thermoleophilia bacterium]